MIFNQNNKNIQKLDSNTILELRNKGMNDHQIIDYLKEQGYDSIAIFEALTDADSKDGKIVSEENNAETQQPIQDPQQNLSQNIQNNDNPFLELEEKVKPKIEKKLHEVEQKPEHKVLDEDFDKQFENTFSQTLEEKENFLKPNTQTQTIIEEKPSQPTLQQNTLQETQQNIQESQLQQNNIPQTTLNSNTTFSDSELMDKIDEVAEAIIDEKWSEMKKYLEKVIDWKGKIENKIITIEEEIDSIKKQIIELQKALLEKVESYDKHISDVGTELKAMERIFQKIIPSLTENVNELSNVVEKIKQHQEKNL